MSKPPLQALIDAYEAGASLATIAERFNISPQTAHNRLTRVGVRMRPAHKPRGRSERTCPTCGRVFYPVNARQRFCRCECMRFKDTCVRGHPLTEETRYHFASGHSRCKVCTQMRNRGEI